MDIDFHFILISVRNIVTGLVMMVLMLCFVVGIVATFMWVSDFIGPRIWPSNPAVSRFIRKTGRGIFLTIVFSFIALFMVLSCWGLGQDFWK